MCFNVVGTNVLFVFKGGVIIIGANSIIYMKQTLPSCGLPINCYAKTSTNFPLSKDFNENKHFFVVVSFDRLGKIYLILPRIFAILLIYCYYNRTSSPRMWTFVVRWLSGCPSQYISNTYYFSNRNFLCSHALVGKGNQYRQQSDSLGGRQFRSCRIS